jgi:hypothetical protein
VDLAGSKRRTRGFNSKYQESSFKMEELGLNKRRKIVEGNA